MVKQFIKKTIQDEETCTSQNVMPFSIAISGAKVCGGENWGSGGGKVCKLTLVIRLGSKPKLINNIISFFAPINPPWFGLTDLVWFGLIWFGLVN